MTTSTTQNARAHARAQIDRALTPDKRQGGMIAALAQLANVLRRYRADLTADDLDDIRTWIVAHIDPIYELLVPAPPDRVWSDNNGLDG